MTQEMLINTKVGCKLRHDQSWPSHQSDGDMMLKRLETHIEPKTLLMIHLGAFKGYILRKKWYQYWYYISYTIILYQYLQLSLPKFYILHLMSTSLTHIFLTYMSFYTNIYKIDQCLQHFIAKFHVLHSISISLIYAILLMHISFYTQYLNIYSILYKTFIFYIGYQYRLFKLFRCCISYFGLIFISYIIFATF